jgi:hypothetical protein
MSPWTQIAIFNDYQGMPYEIEVLFDTGSTSNFITEKIALELGLPLLPLSPRDVKAFTTLQGAEFSPGSYLTTSVRLFKSDSPEDSSNSKVSFRVVDTNKIDLPVPILGYPYIIENRLFERTLVESVTPLKRQPAILGERTPQAEATLDEATLDGSIIHGSPPPVSGWPPMNTPFEQQSVKCVSHVDQATDSGYHSGRGTDLASQYSAATSLSIILTHDTLSEFVDFFANALVHGKDFSSWFSVIQVTLSPALLLQRLDEILKSYAIAASKDAHLELERNALVLVRQHRRQIIQRMTDSSQPISENFNRLKALFKDISLKDKMESWRSGFIKPQAGGEPLDRLTLEKDQSDEEDEAYIEGGDVEFAAVSSFLTQGPHFRLLLQDIKRLYYDRDLKLIETQSAVFDGLRLQEPGEHGRYRASIQLNSDMSRFLEGQFGQNSNQALGSVITLTGSGLYAQATTCTEYVEQNWPVLGVQVLGVLEAALKDGPCHESCTFSASLL